MTTKTRFALAGAATLALALSACSSASSYEGGSIADDYDLSELSVTAGSDNYTEQLVLGQLTIIALEAAGAEVADQTGLGGTQAVRTAITSGEIDLEWDYTGTAWMGFLGQTTPIADPMEQYEAVAEADQENGLIWGAPTPANNTYQLVYSGDTYPDTSFETVSEIADAVNGGEQVRICVGPEFNVREDGLPGMEDHYGFSFPSSDVTVLEDGVIYNELVTEGGACEVGVAFATDGRIEALDLSPVEDDQSFFPAYNAAMVFRSELVDEFPEAVDLFDEIAEALTNEELQAMNAQVDVDGDSPANAAEDWLREQGFIG